MGIKGSEAALMDYRINSLSEKLQTSFLRKLLCCLLGVWMAYSALRAFSIASALFISFPSLIKVTLC